MRASVANANGTVYPRLNRQDHLAAPARPSLPVATAHRVDPVRARADVCPVRDHVCVSSADPQLGWTQHRTPLKPARRSLHDLIEGTRSARLEGSSAALADGGLEATLTLPRLYQALIVRPSSGSRP